LYDARAARRRSVLHTWLIFSQSSITREVMTFQGQPEK